MSSGLGWPILFCIICKTQICKSCLLATLPLNINKTVAKNKKKRFEIFLEAFTGTFRWISSSCIIYRISIGQAKINSQATKQRRYHANEHSLFIIAYFSIHMVCCIE